jgi:hypothetical protein
VSKLSLRQLNRATLARQMLLQRAPVSPVVAVERLAGLQAQMPRPPIIGLWSRVDGLDDRAAVVEAYTTQQLVRATFFRGTLHVVSAADYLRFRGCLGPALEKGAEAILKERAQTVDQTKLLEVAHDLFEEAPRTFEELRPELERRLASGDERALGYLTRMKLPLVMVPEADQPWGYPAIASFALAESRLGKKLATGRMAAGPKDLVLRYLAAFGPASPRDAQVWSGLSNLKPVFEELRDRLAVFQTETGRELFDLPDSPRPQPDVDTPVRFLPEWDNLLLAHDDRTRVLGDAHRRLVLKPGLRVLATFLVDGFVAGLWRIEKKGKTATLSLEPFGRLSKATRAELEGEGEALVRFVEPAAKDVAVRST